MVPARRLAPALVGWRIVRLEPKQTFRASFVIKVPPLSDSILRVQSTLQSAQTAPTLLASTINLYGTGQKFPPITIR